MQDTGKTLAAAIGDIEEAAYLFEYYAGWVTKISGEIPPVGGRSLSLIRSKPVGVAALITPWNFPLLMVAQKAAPALAAGCTCIVKPAEQTPLSALRLGAIAEEVGLPPGTLNVITGDGASAGVPLVRHLGIDMISFTGSVPVGKDIGAVAGGNLKRVTLELGGKSASIVFPDADLERAVEGLCNAGFFNQGQVCGACSRIYLHEDVYDTVLERIGHFVESLIPGHGLDPSTTLGPLISAEHRRRVASFVERGREEGGEILFEGTVPAQPSLRGGYFFAPVVVGGASPTATLSQNEVFGPVVTVQSFRTTDEVIGLVNGTDYGLAGSVWTTDLTTALSVADAIDSGTVWVNDSLKAVSEAMWGGVKNSGVGRELGRAGLDEYLEKRQIYLTLP
jgi:acyl-CoA reductase-like NAD-dependent aldehyde dehydrogenase